MSAYGLDRAALRDLVRSVLAEHAPTPRAVKAAESGAGPGGLGATVSRRHPAAQGGWQPSPFLARGDSASAAPPAGRSTPTGTGSGAAAAPPLTAATVRAAGAGTRQAAPPAAQPSGGPGPRDPLSAFSEDTLVRIDSDEDLHAFALTVLRLADEPRQRAELLAGQRRFRLDRGRPAGAGSQQPAGPTAATRIEKGAVTEAQVLAAAAGGHSLLLGARAVLTPLARDRARALGVRVDKER